MILLLDSPAHRVHFSRRAMPLIVSGLLSLSAMASAADSIIIESAPDGWNHNAFGFEGNWLSSTGKSKAPGLVGTSSVFNTADTNAGTASFSLDIPVPGEYEVAVTYSSSANSKGVKYKIIHADGEAQTAMDQNGQAVDNLKPNGWITVGTYKFKAGPGQKIEISDPNTGEPSNPKEPNVRIYADAVKLTPVGFTLPASYDNKLATGLALPAPATAAAQGSQSQSTSPARPGAQVADTKPAALPPSLDGTARTIGGEAAPPLEPGLNAPVSNSNSNDSLPVLPGLGTVISPTPSSSSPVLPPVLPSGSIESNRPLPSSIPAALPGVTNAAAGLGLPAALPSLSAAERPPISVAAAAAAPSLPSLTDVASQPVSQPANRQPAANVPLALAPVSSLSQPIGGSMPDLASASFGNTDSSSGQDSRAGTVAAPGSLISAPARTPAPTPPPAEDDGTGIQWVYDYYAALSAARNQSKQVLIFFTARGNRVANRYTTEYFKDPVVRAALDRFLLVKLDFPMNTRLAYRLGIFGAGQLAVVGGDDTKLGAIIQMPSSTTEFISALDAIK